MGIRAVQRREAAGGCSWRDCSRLAWRGWAIGRVWRAPPTVRLRQRLRRDSRRLRVDWRLACPRQPSFAKASAGHRFAPGARCGWLATRSPQGEGPCRGILRLKSIHRIDFPASGRPAPNGAAGGTRTPTPKERGPKPRASTSSATAACQSDGIRTRAYSGASGHCRACCGDPISHP